MYERRLKIFFGVLVGATVVLLVRAGYLQVVSADVFADKAARNMRRVQLLETARGAIVDCKGRVLASDEACMVAAVDYRAIERDPVWMKQQALNRLWARQDGTYRKADKAKRPLMLEEEIRRVQADLDAMWRTLGTVSGKSAEEIEQIKAGIRRRVLMRSRHVWYARYRQAVREHKEDGPEPWLTEWLMGGEGGPKIDSFETEVSEQIEAHTILNSISAETHNQLKKQLERLPGLMLRPSKHRLYAPEYARSLCHVLGNLSIVNAEDLKKDPNPDDELRRYYFNDLIGRGGVEALCDQALRGTRGRVERVVADERVVAAVDPVGGKDVKLTIDAELQREIQKAFESVPWEVDHQRYGATEMHGAAVVIDVGSGAVRALVSHPTFDPNQFEELYPVLVRDMKNRPLMNRATQVALEPGSTVKPIVGIGAVTQGLIRVDQGIECTGYLIIDGKKLGQGRCWTASKFGQLGDAVVMHHRIPDKDPHPDGFLTLSDALQRSCNVYFETLGNRMGLAGLSHWYREFGLGRKTGLGIPEWPGCLPDSFEGDSTAARSVSWFSAIGQAQIAATPIQMANVVATIARDGVWMRPTLLTDAKDAVRALGEGPVRVDLKLSAAAVAAAKDGMIRVVNTYAGTGHKVQDDRVLIAGKTGTAEASPLKYPAQVDDAGRPVRDKDGRIEWVEPELSRPEKPNRELPWYRASGTSGKGHHAWFMGFAPAREPKIAFVVMIEYGGSGGGDAQPVVKKVVEACMRHGYLPADVVSGR